MRNSARKILTAERVKNAHLCYEYMYSYIYRYIYRYVFRGMYVCVCVVEKRSKHKPKVNCKSFAFSLLFLHILYDIDVDKGDYAWGVGRCAAASGSRIWLPHQLYC